MIKWLYAVCVYCHSTSKGGNQLRTENFAENDPWNASAIEFDSEIDRELERERFIHDLEPERREPF